jgi:hypothetical protein
MWKQWLLAFLLIFAACGKNDAVRSVGNSGPYPQGPYPQAPYNPGYPPNGGGGYPPFNPQMPPGMPPQYTPFLPIDNYFRSQPQITNVYVNIIWPQWQQYANYYGYNPYDFNTFWYDYCPTTGYIDNSVYQYYDNNYYWWANQGQGYCDYGCDPEYFWSYY